MSFEYTTPASEVQVGDNLILDCSYGAQIADWKCRVIEVIPSNGLFGKLGFYFRVSGCREVSKVFFNENDSVTHIEDEEVMS